MKQSILGAACAGVLVISSGVARASLIDRGGGLIYDTDLNVTWLADANYARTIGYDADGKMTWSTANTWAANLSYYDSVRNVTWDDWRLPNTPQPDPSCSYQYNAGGSVGLQGYGVNCTGSEMGHLYYNELGGVAAQSIATTHDADYNLFTNVQSWGYWSATEYAPNTSNAWEFYFSSGHQGNASKAYGYYAWAVRPGDVAAAAPTVPVPAAVWLFGSGLLGLVGMSRRR